MEFLIAITDVVESLIEVCFGGNTGLEGLVQYCNCSAVGCLAWRSFGGPLFFLLAVMFY